ncbi:MAG: hypothetical protein Q4G67_15550 [Actinomycetia bacterium]|nr:hypothetical protein [Actinomycetes bacterium]
MTRVRISTTVDDNLVSRARIAHGPGTDASLIEAALQALLRDHRAAEIDDAYARVYARGTEPATDDWGDLETFLDAARQG